MHRANFLVSFVIESKDITHRSRKVYKNYLNEFYVAQADAVKRKQNYCINVVRPVNRVPNTILKNLEGADQKYEQVLNRIEK